jgi:hypothetical protein
MLFMTLLEVGHACTRLIPCIVHVMIPTEEFAIDLGSCLRWGKPTVPCLPPITDVLQLKIHLAEVLSCFVRVE